MRQVRVTWLRSRTVWNTGNAPGPAALTKWAERLVVCAITACRKIPRCCTAVCCLLPQQRCPALPFPAHSSSPLALPSPALPAAAACSSGLQRQRPAAALTSSATQPSPAHPRPAHHCSGALACCLSCLLLLVQLQVVVLPAPGAHLNLSFRWVWLWGRKGHQDPQPNPAPHHIPALQAPTCAAAWPCCTPPCSP